MSDDYPHRALLLFPDQLIAPFESTEIEVRADVESLVQRIIMHRSIAARLTLVQLRVGNAPKTRVGSGSCEIFLSDVPNWAPTGMVIAPDRPLRLLVRNMLDQPLKSAGTVVVGVREPYEVEVPKRRRIFGDEEG
jgi:hypothetical protein